MKNIFTAMILVSINTGVVVRSATPKAAVTSLANHCSTIAESREGVYSGLNNIRITNDPHGLRINGNCLYKK